MTTFQQIATEPSITHKKPSAHFPVLLLLACLCELFFLLLLALSPLPGLHLSDTPLVKQWSWTLFPSQLLFSLLGPLITPSHAWFSSLLLGCQLVGVTATYGGAIFVIYRMQHTTSRRWLMLLLAATLIFGLTLLLQPMLLSDDVFTYIFSGRILAIYGADPLNTAPIHFSHDPYLRWVISGRDTPNIYGPLWLCVASLLVSISNNPTITLLLFKAVALLAHLINCVLIWAILGKIAPNRRLLGTLLYTWNPLVLIELAGSGHSEGVLLCLLLLATWLRVQGNGSWSRIGTLLVFGLAISTNLITLLLAPLYIWFEVRGEQHILRAIWGFCWRASIMMIPALIISLPFWRGSSTFFAITSAIDMDHFVHSPVSTLVGPIRGLFQAVADWGRFPAFLRPIAAADVTLRASATFIFAMIYIHAFSQVRSAPVTLVDEHSHPRTENEATPPAFDILLSSWSITVFWYMVLVSGWFWPWYLLWMLWIVALRCFNIFTMTMLILSGTALFIYPFVGFTKGPIATHQTALIFGIPLIYLVIAWSRQALTERTTVFYD